MTLTGELRAWYSHNVELHPGRFAAAGELYRAWAQRADAYFADQH